MSPHPCPARSTASGFTLIEVIAALVMFAAGLLMMLQLSQALSDQMSYASRSGALVVLADEKLDSLESLPADSLALGTQADVVNVVGFDYDRTVTVAQVTALLYSLTVTLTPVAGTGPTYTSMSYYNLPW